MRWFLPRCFGRIPPGSGGQHRDLVSGSVAARPISPRLLILETAYAINRDFEIVRKSQRYSSLLFAAALSLQASARLQTHTRSHKRADRRRDLNTPRLFANPFSEFLPPFDQSFKYFMKARVQLGQAHCRDLRRSERNPPRHLGSHQRRAH